MALRRGMLNVIVEKNSIESLKLSLRTFFMAKTPFYNENWKVKRKNVLKRKSESE